MKRAATAQTWLSGGAVLQPARCGTRKSGTRAEALGYVHSFCHLVGCSAAVLWGTAPAAASAASGQTLGLHAALEGRAGLVDDASRWSLNGDDALYDLGATVRPLGAAQRDDWKLSAELEITAAVGA